MAQGKRPARPRTTQTGRSGGSASAARATSSGAARRAARSRRRRRSPRYGWIAVGVVIIIVGVFIGVRATGSSNGTSDAGQSSGRDPVAVSSAVLQPVINVPSVVFNQVGIDGEPVPFERTTTTTPLLSGGLVHFIYVGAEYCPYCALMRYSLIASLSRFGTFSGLKQTSSADSDGNIPTFSFLGSKYTSKYLVFSPYEIEDRNRNTLQTPPKAVLDIYTKYDYPPYTTEDNEGGIPFFSIGNIYISGGDSNALGNLFEDGTLVNGGPGRQAIADSLSSPFSSEGQAAGGPIFVAQANYISAAICLTNGGKPGNVCNSSGVKAAEKGFHSITPIK